MSKEQTIQDVAMIARNGIDRVIDLERENTALRAEVDRLRALAYRADPVAWLRVIDEAMVVHHLGIADVSDTYEVAKKKLNALLSLNQNIGEYFSAKPVEMFCPACEGNPSGDNVPCAVCGKQEAASDVTQAQ